MKETIERLHAQGGRLTAQRRLILNALEEYEGHPSAEELFEVVRQSAPTLNLSTVYRTLRWLEQDGRVYGRRFSEDPRQERFDCNQPTEHHHFQCAMCKKVVEFESSTLEAVKEQFEKETGARVQSTSLMLYGLCSQCQAEAAAA